MFGFSKETQFKIELLLFLDQQKKQVTSEMITHSLNQASNQTTLKNLKELQLLIAEHYSQEEMDLKITTREGISLIRKDSNFNRLFIQLYSHDLVYALFQQLILTRSFIAGAFCREHAISLSTLRRIIKRVNQALINNQLTIRVGKKVSIVGKESQIRLFFFSLLYFVHKKITAISWIDAEPYLAKSMQIFHFYYLTPTSTEQEVFALWLFINEQAEKKQVPLDNGYKQALDSMDYPEVEFSRETWNFILTIMYILGFGEFRQELSFEDIHQNPYSEAANYWIHLMERDLTPLFRDEKKQIYKKIYKYYLLEQLVPDYTVIFSFTDTEQLAFIRDNFPVFFCLFAKLWDDFITKFPSLANRSIKNYFLKLTYRHTPFEKLLSNISICLESLLPEDHLAYLEKKIQLNLRTLANVHFVSLPEKADILLSTESTASDLLINTTLSNQDLINLKKCVKNQLQKNLPMNSLP